MSRKGGVQNHVYNLTLVLLGLYTPAYFYSISNNTLEI